ncbi:hypothetical protein [Catellatospora tritici]|uniref:hypothetical protein n=1 Tax=Catellatospora tritici TaxID=2851566 RepID=UPI001C2DA4CA|nr:hypothetical protein [Catellatospora tritici]MBV1855075.1 hypothetical protein [Catellatospora tritici]
MEALLLWIGVPVLVVIVLGVIAARRGARHGYRNPPGDYYDGNPWIQSARASGMADRFNNVTG